MKISIKATGIELTPAIEAAVEEKIGGLDKFLGGIIDAVVEVGKSTKHHQKGPYFRAEADLRVSGKIIRAEAETEDLYMAITKLKDELQQEIKKYKEKMLAKEKRGGRAAKRMFKVAEEAQTENDKDMSSRKFDEGV